MKLTPSDLASEISTALTSRGWFVGEGLYSPALCSALLSDLNHLYDQQQKFTKARIGYKSSKTLKTHIRNDYISWLDPLSPTVCQQEYFKITESLMDLLKKELFIPMNAFEAHYAIYEPGGFYKKHLDGFKTRKARMISIILYLNPDWQENLGGELIIYNENNPNQIDAQVTPKFGRFAIFLSQSIYHEVVTTPQNRYSLTGWMRYNEVESDPLALFI